MPMVRPRLLTPRGIFSQLLPLHFQKLGHAMLMRKEDNRGIPVPIDAEKDTHRTKSAATKFRANLMARFRIGTHAPGQIRNTSWCVTTGRWEDRNKLVAGQIFPTALGSRLMRRTTGLPGGIWHPEGGLLLPKPVLQALQDWALVIVPDRERTRQVNRKPPKDSPKDSFVYEYKFRVVDAELHRKTTERLDHHPLIFANRSRPFRNTIYFQACCGIWKKTYLETPECDDEADFVARFLSNLSEFWGLENMETKLSEITAIFLMKRRQSGDELSIGQYERGHGHKRLNFKAGEEVPIENVSSNQKHHQRETQKQTPPLLKNQEALKDWEQFECTIRSMNEEFQDPVSPKARGSPTRKGKIDKDPKK
ncbi:unnamed protein product [Discula destructiva]